MTDAWSCYMSWSNRALHQISLVSESWHFASNSFSCWAPWECLIILGYHNLFLLVWYGIMQYPIIKVLWEPIPPCRIYRTWDQITSQKTLPICLSVLWEMSSLVCPAFLFHKELYFFHLETIFLFWFYISFPLSDSVIFTRKTCNKSHGSLFNLTIHISVAVFNHINKTSVIQLLRYEKPSF